MFERYSTFYDIEKRKQEKKQNLPNVFTDAIIGSTIGQFINDIYFSIFFTDNKILKDDIQVSQFPLYLASTASGAVIGIASQYVDKFALVLLGTVFFVYVNTLVTSIINGTEFKIDSKELIEIVIASIIIIYLFSPKSRNDYLNHKNERLGIETDTLDTKEVYWVTLLVVFISKSYSATMKKIRSQTSNGSSGAVIVSDLQG